MSRSSPSKPQFAPTPRELDDVEILRMGVLNPLYSFEPPGGSITLAVPTNVATWGRSGGGIELTDPEGVPLALVSVDETYPLSGGMTGVVGEIFAMPGQVSRAFGHLYVPPSEPRTVLDDTVVTCVVDAPLSRSDVSRLRETADDAPVMFLVLAGSGTPRFVSTSGLIRTVAATAHDFADSSVVVVPYARRDDDERDRELRQRVVSAYAPGPAIVWASGDGDREPRIDEIVRTDRPEGTGQGLVILFTGLSGSGKSSIAEALRDRILETGSRTVSFLDGDRVRRSLSEGLSFTPADRETNIARIGWVAAEVARHGGMAICSPIAPFDHTRQSVRTMAHDVGAAFVLVYVATPLSVCEARDRKGLYARARRGEIENFTGISSPYEVPHDADLVIDTSERTLDDELDEVVRHLVERGLLPDELLVGASVACLPTDAESI